jgi:hypothetical protein
MATTTITMTMPTRVQATILNVMRVTHGYPQDGSSDTRDFVEQAWVSEEFAELLRGEITDGHQRGDCDISYGGHFAACNECDWIALALGDTFTEETAVCPRCTDDECVRCGEPMRSSTGPDDYPGTCGPCWTDVLNRD